MVKRCAVSAFRDFPEAFREFLLVPKSHGVNVPPLGRENDPMARNKVRNALRLFQAVSRQLLQEAEAKSKSNEKERRRFDLQAAKILKEKGNYVNEGAKILGSVPGVEVGDKFHYRIELNIIGLHRQIQGGIDYVKHKNKILATSIVASGGYYDELDDTNVLIYTGQGGNVMSSDKDPEDQKLERGNLALKNSSEEKNPVRVIRGSESVDGKSKIYVYDGLYLVESCWQEMGSHGKLVYKFRLRRIPGQPELALKEVKQSKRFKIIRT
jgi:euchromatic histone-lysine N-methyltransferase